jgi:hypothetical protein
MYTARICQWLVNVLIEHPNYGDMISNGYGRKWCETNPKKQYIYQPLYVYSNE